MKTTLSKIRAIRWPLMCTRCGSLTHYVEDCRMPSAMCEFERDMIESTRKERNCILAIIATFMVGYLLLSWVGGTGL